jgi:hypothetical protein
VDFSGQTAAPFDRNEDVLVLAFCSFLMKADLGEAGQNLLIPRWQQLLVRGIKNRQKRQGIGGRIITNSNRRPCRAERTGPTWIQNGSRQ